MSLEAAITRIAQEALAEINTFEHYFQETRRRNKSIVPEGTTRNILDTANIASQITTERTPSGLDVNFNADDAHFVLAPDSFHPEYSEIMTNKIADEAAVLLVIDILKDLGFSPK